MRHPFPSFEPYPFAPGHVNESAVDRAMADLEVVSPLLVCQLLSRVEREAVGVFGVIEKYADVVKVHSFPSLASATAIAPAILALFFNRATFARSARPPV